MLFCGGVSNRSCEFSSQKGVSQVNSHISSHLVRKLFSGDTGHVSGSSAATAKWDPPLTESVCHRMLPSVNVIVCYNCIVCVCVRLICVWLL